MGTPDLAEIRWLGLDGARGGWAAAALTGDGRGALVLVSSVAEALERWPNVSRVLVDMPIGLPSDERRRSCDVLGRKLLTGGRASAIFAPPCRQALDAADHAEASRINRRVTGRGISIQAWNLVPRIRELDAMIRGRRALASRVLEAHPEVVFALLSTTDDEAPLPTKRSEEGQRRRRAILSRLLPAAATLLDGVDTPRREAAPDDWTDALALAVTLHVSRGEVRRLPSPPEHDAEGLPMALAVPEGPFEAVSA